MELRVIPIVLLYLTIEQFFNSEVELELHGDLLVEGEALVVEDGLPLVFPDVNEHVGIGHVFFLSFHMLNIFRY